MNAARVREYWQRVWVDGDVGFASEFYAPTYLHNTTEATPDQFANGAAGFCAYWEAFQVSIERILERDDIVVTHVRYRARHIKDWPGVPAVGASIDVTGLDVFRFEDGLVVEHLHEADHEAMWEQLGVPLPPG